MKKIKRLLPAFFVASVGLNAHAQGSPAEYIGELARGGFDVRMHSFLDMEKRMALTVVDKAGVDTKDARRYTAKVVGTNVGAYVYFTAYRPCLITAMIQNGWRFILIEGQKVEADYSCTPGAGKFAQETQENYTIKSGAGNNFAKKTFSEKALVLVHLNGVPVPFNMEGFSEVFAAASSKPL